MRLLILHVPECPGAEALESRLAPLLAARPDIQVVRQVVTTEDEARRLGMTGSPTILTEGADLFARPRPRTSRPCRAACIPTSTGTWDRPPRLSSSARR